MSLKSSLIPRCRAVATTTRDGQTDTHYCEHPFGHDGDHGARSPSGCTWYGWSHIVQVYGGRPDLPQPGRAGL